MTATPSNFEVVLREGDREPKESILNRFDVTVILRYFLEFAHELPATCRGPDPGGEVPPLKAPTLPPPTIYVLAAGDRRGAG